MSAPSESAGTQHAKELADLPVAQIDRNPKNPRIHFTPEEMDRLAESIDKKGILVPVVVFPANGGYHLLDGERRWRCAQELGLETIPAVITDAPDDEENIVQMFNIHMVRESWKDMPTAWALRGVMEESGIESNRELSELTGLSVERIRRLRHAAELPSDYQRYIDEERIPLNFFWELKRSVIDPLAKKRPALAAEFGETEILDAFVEKRLKEVVTDTVSLRLVTPIINFAARDVEDPSESSPLDDTLRHLVTTPEASVLEAYEDTVQVVFETEELGRRAENVVKSFERLLERASTSEELEFVKQVGRTLVDRISSLVR